MADKEKKATAGSKVEKATTEESKAAEKVAKAAKGEGKKDKPSFLTRTSKGTKKFFKDFKGECKKIVWPDAKTVLKSTGIVLLVVGEDHQLSDIQKTAEIALAHTRVHTSSFC